MNPGKIAVVIAAWNLRDCLRECLASIVREARVHPCAVTVVDNGSTDGSAEMAAREFPDVRVIRNADNTGFVRASNLGARRAMEEDRPEYLLFLNADAVLCEGAPDRLADYLDAHPGVAAAGPLLVLPDGRFQPGPAGFKPTLGSALAYFSFAGRVLPAASRPLFVDPRAAARRGGRPVRVGWLSGACLMVRTDTIRRVGLMNEEYFLYADDIEWGGRLNGPGRDLHLLPSVRAIHRHGITIKKNAGGFNTVWLDQLFRHVRKTRGPAETALFRLTAAAGFGLRAAVHAVRALVPSGPLEMKGRQVREMLAYAEFSLSGRKKQARESIGYIPMTGAASPAPGRPTRLSGR